MHGTEGDSLEWFANYVLMNTADDGHLILHSNEIGDEVGAVRVLVVHDWPPNAQVTGASPALMAKRPVD
jgi:hypothetical protein